MVFFIIFILCSILLPFHLHGSVANFLQDFHSLCLNRLPTSDAYEVTSAFVCGEKIRSAELTDFFSRSGLFHLVIVSKAHLEFLSTLLLLLGSFLKDRGLRLFIIFFTVFYILMCGPQAPLVRTGVFLVMHFASRYFRLGWSAFFILMLATCLSLAFNFEWYNSLSLLHSSGCALAFLIGQRCTTLKWQQGVIAFVLTTPFLWGWANIHPLTILINWTLAPLLFIVWFLVSLLTFIIPTWHFISDYVIQRSIFLVSSLLEPIPAVGSNSHVPVSWLWFFFWSLLLIFWTFHCYKRQSK